MYDIDAEVLLINVCVSLEESWKNLCIFGLSCGTTHLQVFKDWNATRNAWSEVCLALKPSDFDVINNKEKNLLLTFRTTATGQLLVLHPF